MPITSTPNRGISPSLPPVSPASHSDLTSPPSSLDSSFNSTMSLDSAGMETGSLNGLFKSRRARKKSWRQVGYTVSIVTWLLFIFSLCTKLLLFKKQTCQFCFQTFYRNLLNKFGSWTALLVAVVKKQFSFSTSYATDLNVYVKHICKLITVYHIVYFKLWFKFACRFLVTQCTTHSSIIYFPFWWICEIVNVQKCWTSSLGKLKISRTSHARHGIEWKKRRAIWKC